MSTDTERKTALHMREDRRTTSQLLTAAALDTDPVSVFEDGSVPGEADRAIFVVKGREHIDYLRSLCKRQGLLTDKPVTGPACNLQRPWEQPE